MTVMGLDWHLLLSVGVFLAVIAAIAFEWLPMVVASLLGTAILYLTGVIGTSQRLAARSASDPVLCLEGNLAPSLSWCRVLRQPAPSSFWVRRWHISWGETS
jgi:hypothetical protein